MKGLLLAGGRGTRLRPLTFTGNKHMLPIANKPMILYGLEHLRAAGIEEIGIILGPIREGVVELLGDGRDYGVDITYIDQPEPRGLAHAVQVAAPFLDDAPFTMYLGDNLLKQGAQPLIDVFTREGCDAVIAVAEVDDPSRYGVVVFDEDGTIERLVEKPRDPISRWALVGVYVFNPMIFDAVQTIQPSWRGELEITDAIQTLLDRGATVQCQYVQGWWKDTGKPDDLLEANQLILQELAPVNQGTVDPHATLTGTVAVGPGTVIHDRTTLRGPVVLGANCEVGPNAYIGPYTAIGDDVTIRNSELENSIVMRGTLIDCGRRIVDSLIGQHARVVSAEQHVPKGHKLILGDLASASL